MVTILPPLFEPYWLGLVFVIVSQIVTVPLCILSHSVKNPAVFILCGMISAVCGYILPPILAETVVSNGLGTPLSCLLGRFLGSTTYAFVGLRMFGAAVGATPKGADADVKTWITFATGALDITFNADGKPIRPAPGAVANRVGWVFFRLAGLSVCSSLSEPFGGYPLTTALGQPNGFAGFLTMFVDRIYIQLMIIYLFLSLLMDVGSILLLAQGFVPIDGFANPIFTATSARIFWGQKWNLQVTNSFKRCVFTPLSRSGTPKTLAAFLTFLASGLFHEYQFVLSFPNYTLGRASLFFLLHGLTCAGDAYFSKTFGNQLRAVPWQLKALAVVFIYSPTVPMFANIWVEEGFFKLISRLSVLVTP